MSIKPIRNFHFGQPNGTYGRQSKLCVKVICFNYKKFIVIKQRKPNIHINRLKNVLPKQNHFFLSTIKFNDYYLK